MGVYHPVLDGWIFIALARIRKVIVEKVVIRKAFGKISPQFGNIRWPKRYIGEAYENISHLFHSVRLPAFVSEGIAKYELERTQSISSSWNRIAQAQYLSSFWRGLGARSEGRGARGME